MENYYLWKFYWCCGRSGNLEGLFVATEDEIKQAIGREAYFGEILGKHSEVYGELKKKDITKVELDPETVEKVTNLLGKTWSGFNPLNYVQYECEVCEGKFNIEEFNLISCKCGYCLSEEDKDGYESEENNE